MSLGISSDYPQELGTPLRKGHSREPLSDHDIQPPVNLGKAALKPFPIY